MLVWYMYIQQQQYNDKQQAVEVQHALLDKICKKYANPQQWMQPIAKNENEKKKSKKGGESGLAGRRTLVGEYGITAVFSTTIVW